MCGPNESKGSFGFSIHCTAGTPWCLSSGRTVVVGMWTPVQTLEERAVDGGMEKGGIRSCNRFTATVKVKKHILYVSLCPCKCGVTAFTLLPYSLHVCMSVCVSSIAL